MASENQSMTFLIIDAKKIQTQENLQTIEIHQPLHHLEMEN